MSLREHIQIIKRALKMCFAMERCYTVCGILNAFLTAITWYIPVYFSAKVIDALYAQETVAVFAFYVTLTVGLVFLVRVLNEYIVAKQKAVKEAMYRNEDWMYSEKAMQMAYESIEDPEVKKLRHQTRMDSQTGYNRYYLHQTIWRFTSNITKIAASVIMTFSFFAQPSIPIYSKLGMVAGLIATIIVVMFSGKQQGRLSWYFSSEENVALNMISGEFYNFISDYSSGKDIRLYGMQDFLAEEFFRLDMESTVRYIKKSYLQALWTLPVTVIQNVFKYSVYIVLIYAAMSGGISVGSIAKYVSCIMLLISSVSDMVYTLQLSLTNNKFLKRFFAYFDISNNMYKGTLTVEKRDDNEYNVEFRDVSFKYPNTEVYALRHVNLKFKIGEKLAIVGMNGSGKTTFIKLLCRLYDPTEGEILLNGVNIQKYDYDEYMSIFSVVFQDFQIFGLRLGEVVASSRRFDGEKVYECLTKANFGDRLKELPQGADTYLYKSYDKSGIELSGGEAQKIALARALYKDAPFILLDEPTAALDPISEYEVYSNFNAISGDKTAVYISHRLASCRFCDKIAVFDKGRIVQMGNHEQLVGDTVGKYHELWHAQAQYYVTDNGTANNV